MHGACLTSASHSRRSGRGSQVPARLIRLGALVSALFMLSPGSLLAVGNGNGRMIATPTRVVAGSTGNTLTFTFTAVPRAQVGQLTIDTPVQWSAWQTRDPAGPGYVTFNRGTCSAKTRISSISRRATEPPARGCQSAGAGSS